MNGELDLNHGVSDPDPTVLSSLRRASFSYAALPEQQAVDLKDAASRIRSALHNSVAEIGQQLLKARRLVKHGMFQAWAKDELGISPRSASRYMQAARFMDGKSAILADLPPAVIYRLADPNADQTLVADVLAAAGSGEALVVSDIKRRLDQVDLDAADLSAIKLRRPKLSNEKAKRLLSQQREEESHQQAERRKIEDRARAIAKPLAERVASLIGTEAVPMWRLLADWKTRFIITEALIDALQAGAIVPDPANDHSEAS